MLKSFSIWIESIRNEYSKRGIAFFDVVCSNEEVEEKSARVDFSYLGLFGRITLWDTGESDLELLDSDTGDIINYITVVVCEQTFRAVYESYFDSMKNYNK